MDRTRYRDALIVPEFRALFAAYSVSLLGTIVATVALTVLVYARTGSSALAALTFTLMFVPYLLAGGLLNALVDRQPPRRLMVACDLASAALIAVMALPAIPIAAMLGLLVLVSLLAPISAGARNALLPKIVGTEAYVPARSLFRLVAQSAQVVGNALGGLLLVLVAPRHALLIDAASFVVSALVVRFGTRPRAPTATASSTLLSDSLKGIKNVFAHPTVRRLLLLGWFVPMCSVAPEALAAPYVHDLGRPAAAVGWWLVMIPAGTVVGEVIGITRMTQPMQRRLVGTLAACTLLPQLAFLVAPGYAAALVLLFLSGLGSAYVLGLDGLVLDAAPLDLRSRVLSLNTTGLMTLQGLGFGLAGVAGEVIPLPAVVAGSAALGLLAVLWLRPRRARLPLIVDAAEAG